MPTGYTVGIEDGRIITGKDFLRLCTRAFGVAIDLKEEPLSVPTPRTIKPDTYFKDRLEEEKANLEKYKRMSFDEAKAEMLRSYADRVDIYRRMAEGSIERNKKYAKVRAEVKAWIPPTDAHRNLKNFALEQIDMCIEKQEHIDEWLQQANEKLDDSDEAVERYIAEQIEYHCESVKRAEENWKEELERVADRNSWMEEFLGSL